VLLGLGLTTTAFAVVAGSLVWAWAPQIGNWTLSPQQIAESAKDPGSRSGRAWVPPEMPPINPWNTAENSTSTPTNSDDGEQPTQIASVQTAGTGNGGHGPLDLDSQQPPNVDHVFGLFSSPTGGSVSGGQGGSWNGTFNPNGGRARTAGFPSYTGGTGGPGTPPKSPPAPKCDEGLIWNGQACVPPEQKTTLTTPPDEGTTPPSGEGSCTTEQVWNGSACVPKQTQTTGPESCTTEQVWNGSACVPKQTQATGPESCTTEQVWNGSACVPKQTQATGPESCTGGTIWNGTVCALPNPDDGVETGNETCTGQSCSTPSVILVPEPGTLLMFALGLLGLGWMVRRRA
jgi:hypothetical protein